jgi:hypothetical protein
VHVQTILLLPPPDETFFLDLLRGDEYRRYRQRPELLRAE